MTPKKVSLTFNFASAVRLARALSAEYNCLVPHFDATHPVADCWVDRMAWVNSLIRSGTTPKEVSKAVREANIYSGRQVGRAPAGAALS